MPSKKPIINCHTHIFTGDHIPPYLAKTFIPLVYKLLSLRAIIIVFRWWYRGPYRWVYKSWYRRMVRRIYHIRIGIERSRFKSIVYWAIGTWILLQFAYLALKAYMENKLPSWLENMVEIVFHWPFSFIDAGWPTLLVWGVFFYICFPFLRRLLFLALKNIFRILKLLPGKQTMELIRRYLNIGRYSFYRSQKKIFQTLARQYPPDTEFVVLQMDMEFMDAGLPKADYYQQLRELSEIKERPQLKDRFHPFIFIDPRRISRDKDFFRYRSENGKVILEDCTIKTYIEDKSFAGFKIYPALGYHCFDGRLLPLWKYAADNGIPIMTHCIRGTIFFRGKKLREWDLHPVFQQVYGKGEYKPLLLPETGNIDFQVNFTHPLNYLCLLDRGLLHRLIASSNDPQLQQLFGYGPKQLEHGLEHLKLCFAHFGGEDQWKRYFETDRYAFSSQLTSAPHIGIDFMRNHKGEPSMAKLEQLWKNCDWYSIICSLMLQYENIYSDISYISHDNAIHALLKRTLNEENKKLRSRVLFGTDFYVVRNHKSEKQILADTLAGLTPAEFDLIARDNPISYLQRSGHQSVFD